MTISNALPIQFWATGTETFNELDVCGINDICFCQPVQCSDEVKIQFEDTAGQTLILVGVSEDNAVRIVQVIPEIITGVYQLTQTLDEACGDVIQLLIMTDAQLSQFQLMKAPSIGWIDDTNFGAGVWTRSATQLTGAFSGSESRAAYQLLNVAYENAEEVTFVVNIALTGVFTGQVRIQFVLYDASFVPVAIYSNDFSAGTYNGTVIIMTYSGSSTNDAIMLYCWGFGIVTSGSATVAITITPTVVEGADSPADITEYELRSDCIDVKEEQECTKLITYSNNSDFAGLVYEGTSPAIEFHLRVPAMLFRATRPEEQEVHPLSNDEWLRVWSRMTKKMRLELGYMPDYMHEKLQLIFMHDNVEIDGLSWKKRDAYELIEGDKRNPLMKANVLLTDKTFIKRNLI